MIGSIESNLYRLFRSKTFYGLLAFVILFSLKTCFYVESMRIVFYEEEFQPSNFYSSLALSLLVSVVFIFIFNVGKGHRTAVKTKVISGNSRLVIYLSDLITSLVITAIYCGSGVISIAFLDATNGMIVIPNKTYYITVVICLIFVIPLITLITGASYNNPLLGVFVVVVIYALFFAVDFTATSQLENVDHEYIFEDFQATDYIEGFGYFDYTGHRLVANPDFNDTTAHSVFKMLKKVNPVSNAYIIEVGVPSQEEVNESCNKKECSKMSTSEFFLVSSIWSVVFIASGLVVYKKTEMK